MRVAIVIERKNHYRLLAPVVDAALARGWDVACLHDQAQLRTGIKGYEFPETTAVPAFRHGQPLVEVYHGAPTLLAALDRTKADAVVSLGVPPVALRPDLGARSVAWVTLQYHGELYTNQAPPDALFADTLGIYSSWWLDQAVRYFVKEGALSAGGDVERALRGKSVAVGFPELDQLPAIDPSEVRRRWNLPADRPVVLFLPYPFQSNPTSPWTRWAFGGGNRVWRRLRLRLAGQRRLEPAVAHGWDDPGVCRAIRAFCDANDALLVVKARRKDPVTPYLLRLADQALYDETQYPTTILEALSIASLCVHFYSTAVMEAVAASVPSLSICPEYDDMGIARDWQESFYVPNEGSLFQFRGVAETATVAEVVERLPRRRLADFTVDAGARELYTAKFTGAVDGKSAHRLLDAVEATSRGAA
jgi:hypothetical protein